MKSFALIRTSVALTTNAKVMVPGNYNLSLDSIDSDPALSADRFKGFKFRKDNWYDEILPKFFQGLPPSIGFKVKDNDDKEIMLSNFENQYDDIYQSGCRNISNNKSYSEEFECFAPLYLGSELPSHFIVFRIDGPGNISLNKDNFRSEILEKLKVVTIFDLTPATPLGEWLNKNFIENEYKPDYPLYIDFRRAEFSSWKGIDYEVGGWCSKSVFLDTTLEYENTFFDLEKSITDGYRENKVVFPNILNLSFLFDDTPATPDSLRKWSLNRYMGFYLDNLDRVYAYTPYDLESLRSDVIIRPGNILSSPSSENPFVKEWSDAEPTYVEVNGSYYKVERYFRNTSPTETKVELATGVYSDEVVLGRRYFWKILSEDDFTGLTYSSINSNNVEISSDSNGWYIKKTNETELIPKSDTADVWIVKIHEKYHTLKKIGSNWYINSDYGFELSDTTLRYWIDKSNISRTVQVPLDPLNPSINFIIYRLNFTQIRDLDTSIVDTKFSRYEYENELKLTDTEQPKLYAQDLSANISPAPYNDYLIENNLANVPCSSEYTANGELFRLQDNKLTQLWNKNPVRVKWAFDSSISANDHPYQLNNSFLADDFNMSTNVFSFAPKRWDRNLDYFYSVNSATNSTLFHSLHVEDYKANGDIDTTSNFDLSEYLDNSKDYFTYFFGKNSHFSSGNIISKTNKWSIFQKGNSVIPNSTLFKGIKFDIFNVVDLKIEDNKISNINLSANNEFQDWKFSVLLSKNDFRVVASSSTTGIIEPTSNFLSWSTIDEWKYSKYYTTTQLVTYQYIIWQANSNHSTTNPSSNPAKSPDWILHSTQSGYFSASYSVFWHPQKNYTSNDWVYYAGDYYFYEPKGTSYSFWNPRATYNINDYVIYGKDVWRSTTASNFYQPGASDLVRNFTTNDKPYYWEKWTTSNPTDWQLVELWSQNKVYSTSSVKFSNFERIYPGRPYVVWNNTLYKFIGATSSTDEPTKSTTWERIYSFIPDSDFVYTGITNSIIEMNNTYYLCLSNPNRDTLENGICVYINKKWKNILVNIYINDNTLANIKNANRDSLYNQLYGNLTAANLISAMSNMANKFGFSDYLKYVVISDSGLSVWDYTTINTLPYLIKPQMPDYLWTRYGSLLKQAVGLNQNLIKPKRALVNRNIETIDMLNYYNGNKPATTIERNKLEPELVANYSGLENKIFNLMWRYSGNYSPLTYEIPLFKTELVGATDSGNFKFDTTLTDFGMMRERIMSKVNRADNVLKLRRSTDLLSVYPMLDEFGYTTAPFFIFKSTWDKEFYRECLDLTQADIPILLTNKIVRFE